VEYKAGWFRCKYSNAKCGTVPPEAANHGSWTSPSKIPGVIKMAVGVFPDRDFQSLAVKAGRKCFRNAAPRAAEIDAFYLCDFAAPSFVGRNHREPYVSNALGIEGVPATRIEAACASSGSAFCHAWTEDASASAGRYTSGSAAQTPTAT
jgi:acetyl-CoA acetyltransferase